VTSNTRKLLVEQEGGQMELRAFTEQMARSRRRCSGGT
jgi:hypothetical protein